MFSLLFLWFFASEFILVYVGPSRRCCCSLTGAVLSILLILGVEVVDGVRHDVARVHGLLEIKIEEVLSY